MKGERTTMKLAGDLALTRPALLYSSHVRLISTAYTVNKRFGRTLSSCEQNPKELIDLILSMVPAVKLDGYWAELAKARRDFERSTSQRKRRGALAKMQEFARTISEADADSVILGEMFDPQGMEELHEVEARGDLSIEELPGLSLPTLMKAVKDIQSEVLSVVLGQGSSEPDDSAFEGMAKLVAQSVRRLVEVMRDPYSYPILDAQAKEIVSGLAPQEKFSATAMRRTKYAALMGCVVGRLPGLHEVRASHVCDIRYELGDHLGALQAAIAELADELRFEPCRMSSKKKSCIFRQSGLIRRSETCPRNMKTCDLKESGSLLSGRRNWPHATGAECSWPSAVQRLCWRTG